MSIPKPTGITCDFWEPSDEDPKKRRCRFFQSGGTCLHETGFLCVEWAKRNLPSSVPLAGPSRPLPPAAQPRDRSAPQNASGEARAPQGDTIAPPPPVLSLLCLPPSPPAGVESPGNRACPDAPPPTIEKTSAVVQAQPAGSVANTAQKNFLTLVPTDSPVVRETTKTAARDRPMDAAMAFGAQRAAAHDFKPAKEISTESIAALEALAIEITLETPGMTVDPPYPIVLVAKRTGRTDRHEISYSEAATLRLLVDMFPGCRVTQFTGKK